MWGGWGSNSRPANYESSMPACAGRGIYLRKYRASYRCQLRSGLVFATVGSEELPRAVAEKAMRRMSPSFRSS